jgi:hypothetical protein
MKVTNPVATWGGAEAETVSEGEKQIARYLQHRDRLVNAVDFETITRRTPGVDIGRVDVLPAYTPELGTNEPGDAPGAVTVMVIPKYDPLHPLAPQPERPFVDTICAHIDSRRLVTTEVFVRGPDYKDIWISVGINVVSAASDGSIAKAIAEVREAVKREMLQFLSPLPAEQGWPDDQTMLLTTLEQASARRGWPLRRPVVALELMAVASRVAGVSSVKGVLLAESTADPGAQVEMRGLQLPRVAGIAISVGDPLDLADLRGRAVLPTDGGDGTRQVVPIPVVAEECK